MLTFEQATSSRCEICHERSAWDFLRDFYLRVEAAHEYARSLENELYVAQSAAHQAQSALTQCESSLVNSLEQLNEERLDHRASQEALTFERASHKETAEMLEQVFREATRSAEIADRLSLQVATLQSKPGQALISQPTESLKDLPGTNTSSPEPLSEKPRATHSTNPNLSSVHELHGSSSA